MNSPERLKSDPPLTEQFFSAIQEGDNVRMRALLARHPELLHETDEMMVCGCINALMQAAHSGNSGAVQELLPLLDAHQRSGGPQYTALMFAAINGDAQCVSLLLPVSDVNARDKVGRTALTLALHYHNEEAVAVLAPHTTLSDALEQSNFLRSIAEMENPAFARMLLPYLDARLQEPHSGETALMRAARAGNAQTLRVLLTHCNPNTVNNFGFTALLRAVENDEVECLKVLLPSSDLSYRKDGSNALEAAMQWQRWRCADVLMEPLGSPEQAMELCESAPVGLSLPVSRALLERQALSAAVGQQEPGSEVQPTYEGREVRPPASQKSGRRL